LNSKLKKKYVGANIGMYNLRHNIEIEIKLIQKLTNHFNKGTTVTSLLAALASSSSSTPKQFELSLRVALCHTFFNISGI